MNAASRPICSTAIAASSAQASDAARRLCHTPSSEAGSARAATGIAAASAAATGTATQPCTFPATGVTIAVTVAQPKTAIVHRSKPARFSMTSARSCPAPTVVRLAGSSPLEPRHAMIGGVNPLTARATPSAVPRDTIGSGAVRPWLDALIRLGYDRVRLLTSAGITSEAVADPDARVPCTAPERLVTAAFQERPRPNLALDLAAATPIGAYPLFDYLALSSATVGDCLARLARYYPLLGAPGALEPRDHVDPIEVLYVIESPFAAEYGIALALLHIGRESEGRARAQTVRFTHRPGDVREWERAIGAPVEAGAAWNGFTMSRETWRLPMRRRDPILLSVLERHADDVLPRTQKTEDVVEQVRHALARGLTAGDGAMPAVARSLALAPRTLQRRLAVAGTTFQRVLEETREQAAIRHLKDSALSIAEIAFVLGYSEPAAFHRA